MDGKRKLDALVTVDSDDESIPDLRSETSSNIDPGDVSPGDADSEPKTDYDFEDPPLPPLAWAILSLPPVAWNHNFRDCPRPPPIVD